MQPEKNQHNPETTPQSFNQPPVQSERPSYENPLPPISNSPTQPLTETASFQADLPPIKEDVSLPRSHRNLLRIIIVIAMLVLLGAGGYFVYAHLQGKSTPFSETFSAVTPTAPLVTSTVLNTTFKYPEGWNPMQPNSKNYYGSTDLDNEQYPLAEVNVAEGAQDTSLVNASTETYATLRKTYLEKGAPSFKSNTVTGGLMCRGQTDKIVSDTEELNNAIGLVLTTTTKPCESGERVTKKRTVIGTDGRMRYISVDATAEEWVKNKATFDAILSSIGVLK